MAPWTQTVNWKWWWWWIVFVLWLTDGRRLALFTAGTIVRDPHYCKSPTHREQIWTCVEPECRLCWMKLCSRDNHYITAPSYLLLCGGVYTIIMKLSIVIFYLAHIFYFAPGILHPIFHGWSIYAPPLVSHERQIIWRWNLASRYPYLSC